MRVSISLVSILSLSLLAGVSPSRAQEPAALPAEAEAPKMPTSAERKALARAQYEVQMRAMMNDLGIAEAAPQDAVLAYLAEDEAGIKGVLSAGRRMMSAARQDAPPERIQRLLASYKAAIDADRERRHAAQTVLDAKIGFSLNPRLEATLWMMGVLGEGRTGLPLTLLFPRTSKNAQGEANRDGGHDGNRDGGRDGNRDGGRDGNRDGGHDGNRDGARRGGTVRGVVTRKAQGWIEVRADSGALDRYLPFWAGGEAGLKPGPTAPVPADGVVRFNRATLENLARVQIGERVVLDWVWDNRKRVVRLEIEPPTPTPPAPTVPPPATTPEPQAPPQDGATPPVPADAGPG